jgi:uncharacterized protein YjbJ (UPF0337 family)
MSENTGNDQLGNVTNDLKASAEKAAEAAGKTWDETKDKIEGAVEKLGDKAEAVWDKVEDKAEAIWDKAQSGELKEEAKAKLEDLAEGAKGLWNKLVDKLDGDDTPAGEEKQA